LRRRELPAQRTGNALLTNERVGVLAAALLASACATLTPPLDAAWRDPEAVPASRESLPLALIALGGIGEPHGREQRLHVAMSRRIEGAPSVPILVLGEVFERAGLLGFCTSESHRRVSDAGCAQQGSADAQFDAILGPYARKFVGHSVVALAGVGD